MASITPRKNKNGEITSYTVTVSLGYGSDGQKIRETTTFHPTAKTPAKSRKEAEEFAVMFEKQVREGTLFNDGDRIRFRDFVKFWDEEYLAVRVSTKDMTQVNRENYISTLNRCFVPSIGHMKLTEIKSVHIDKIINGMIRDGKSPKTIRNYFNVVRSIFDYAYRKNFIRENPCSRCNPLPKLKRGSELHCFTEDQVQRFLNDALTMDYEFTIKGHTRRYSEKGSGEEFAVKEYTERHSVSLQFRVYFTLAVYSGCRRAELIALRWEDIDDVKRTIRIDEAITASVENGEEVKDPKTENGKRTIKLPEVCFDLLREWKLEQKKLSLKLGSAWKGERGRDYDKNFIFIQTDSGERMNVQTPSGKFRKILVAYNKTVDEEDRLPLITLHDLRHTNASHLIANGTDFETVAKRLGHSKASFTLDVYGHALPEKDDKASDLLEEIFGKAK